MNSKFEDLNDQLFTDKIEKNEMASIKGGWTCYRTGRKTYVMQYGDEWCETDDTPLDRKRELEVLETF